MDIPILWPLYMVKLIYFNTISWHLENTPQKFIYVGVSHKGIKTNLLLKTNIITVQLVHLLQPPTSSVHKSVKQFFITDASYAAILGLWNHPRIHWWITKKPSSEPKEKQEKNYIFVYYKLRFGKYVYEIRLFRQILINKYEPKNKFFKFDSLNYFGLCMPLTLFGCGCFPFWWWVPTCAIVHCTTCYYLYTTGDLSAAQ